MSPVETLASAAPSAAAFLLEAGLRSALVLGAVALILRLWHDVSAATRYRVWMLALLALPAVILLPRFAPEWTIAVAPQWISDLSPTAWQPAAPNAVAPDGPLETLPSESQRGPTALGTTLLGVLLVWLGGAAFVLSVTLVAMWSLRRLESACRTIERGNWLRRLSDAKARLGVQRHVVLLRSPRRLMPMTWRLTPWTPDRILIPAGARGWSHRRKHAVLLHELAHVRRGDSLMHVVARGIGALLWFNPLVWHALRQLRLERERACDDMVLRCGVSPADYAEDILSLAAADSGRRAEALAFGMAHAAALEARLVAILDPRRRRETVDVWKAARIAMIIACVALPASMLSASSTRIAAVPVSPGVAQVVEVDDLAGPAILLGEGRLRTTQTTAVLDVRIVTSRGAVEHALALRPDERDAALRSRSADLLLRLNRSAGAFWLRGGPESLRVEFVPSRAGSAEDERFVLRQLSEAAAEDSDRLCDDMAAFVS